METNYRAQGQVSPPLGVAARLCLEGPLTTKAMAGPSWAKNLPIYEVNLDAYGFPKGKALREYEKHFPVLKEMGVGMLWFMPLHPRGQKKGFGSPYSVRDYTAINPDLGTKEDFRRLVIRAHALGLRVLMDWVPNHTAWDNPMIDTHPDFYVRDDKGQVQQAGPWADVAQLDYGKPGRWNQPLWDRMRDDMALWVRELAVDGFRCDVAGRGGKVPVDFWRWLRPQLDAIRPIFMLGEADDAYLHPAFDMTFSWNLPPVLWDICAGRL
ncbi:MAG: alpha-amylase, partial [Akkermansiaceae bacterium]|nr:alpha-amylase [Armatimonadota bacterium]